MTSWNTETLQQESTCNSECHREATYMLCGNEWEVAHLTPLPLFLKSRPELPPAMLGIKGNRNGWRKLRASLHWHWGAVLCDQFDNPSQVFLRSLMLGWSLLTSGQRGWMTPCFSMYQLLDKTPCVLSAWWFRTSGKRLVVFKQAPLPSKPTVSQPMDRTPQRDRWSQWQPMLNYSWRNLSLSQYPQRTLWNVLLQ